MPRKRLVVEHKTSSEEIGLGSRYWKRLVLDSQISFYLVGARALGHEPDGVLYDVVRKIDREPYKATPIEDREYKKEKSKACPECKKKKQAYPAPHFFRDLSSGEIMPPPDAYEVEPGTGRVLVYDACVDGRIVTDPCGQLYANQREHDETLDEFRDRITLEVAEHPEKYYQRGVVHRLEAEELASAHDAWGLAEQIKASRRLVNWPRNVDACFAHHSQCEYWSVCTNEASIDDPTRYAVKPTKRVTKLPVLSASSAKCYRQCPRKYFYAYELRKRAVESAHALRFGTLFHVGLEQWWKTVDIELAISTMRAEYKKQQTDPVDAVKAEVLLRGYHMRWKDEPLSVLAVEEAFEAPLVNPETGAASKTFQRGGKVDALVMREEEKQEAAE